MNKRLPYALEKTSAITLLESEDVFTAIVYDHSAKLISIAFKITKNGLVAEDIVQEAFLKLWQKRAEVIPDNLGGWLYKVVSHLAYKHQQKESRRLRVVNSLIATKGGFCQDVEMQLINKENDRMLQMIVNRLPKKQRQVYHLSREKGLNRHEIADQLKVSPNTVKVHLSRALQFLREHLVACFFFILFFIFNNIFFQKSNTICSPGDLYKEKQMSEKELPDQQITLLHLMVKLQ